MGESPGTQVAIDRPWIANEADGFERVFRETFATVAGTLVIALGDRDRAYAQTHDAFVRLHVRWQTRRTLGEPVRAVWRSAVRLAGHDAVRPGPVALAAEDVGCDEDLWSGLFELEPRERLALALVYFAGLPIHEAAHAMACPEADVERSVRNAKVSLERHLGVQSRSGVSDLAAVATHRRTVGFT